MTSVRKEERGRTVFDHDRDVARPPLLPRVLLGVRVLALSLWGNAVPEEVLDPLLLAEDHGPDPARVVPVPLHLGGREWDEDGASRGDPPRRIRDGTAFRLGRWRRRRRGSGPGCARKAAGPGAVEVAGTPAVGHTVDEILG